MRINEIKARLTATRSEPAPVDQIFLSLGELLLRVQRTPETTMQQAADCLLSWGLLMEGAPKIMVNSKTCGIVPADKQSEKWAIARLEFVFHRGHFESDEGGGASVDYDLFGFHRKEFSDFLSTKVGESLDLFGPIPDQTPTIDSTSPAPSLAGSMRHKIRDKAPSILTAEIAEAKRVAPDPASPASVWDELTKLAGLKYGVLVGVIPEGIQYRGKVFLDTDEEYDIFTRRSLTERMRRSREGA